MYWSFILQGRSYLRKPERSICSILLHTYHKHMHEGMLEYLWTLLPVPGNEFTKIGNNESNSFHSNYYCIFALS